MSEQRAQLVQAPGRVDPERLHELSKHALLAQDVTTMVKTLAPADFPYTVTEDDHVLLCTDTSAMAITLPDAATVPGREYMFKKTTTAVVNITLTPAAGNIDAGASFVFGGSGRLAATVASDGTDWWVVAT